MKINIFALLAIVLGMGSHNCLAQTEITSWSLNLDSSVTGYNNLIADVTRVRYSNDNVYINSTGVPNHSIGPWGNPTDPGQYNYLFRIKRNPTQATSNPTTVPIGAIAIATTGVLIYSASNDQTYNNQGIWHEDAGYFELSTLDNCYGHNNPVQGSQLGQYHLHGNPGGGCMYTESAAQHSPLIGYAFDGYPIYGAYGYSDPNDSNSSIKRMVSGYSLRNITDRTTLPNGGGTLSPAQYGPAINSTYPLGAFWEDYEYSATGTDLDEHNGRFAKTPEYPNGTYAYYMPLDGNGDLAFPYTIGPYEYYGVTDSDNFIAGGVSTSVTVNETVQDYTGGPISSTTNISETQSITAFPNPGSSVLNLKLDGFESENFSIRIFSVEGRLAYQADNQMADNNAIIQLDEVSQLANGIYTIQLIGSSTSANVRWVKQ